MSTPQFTMKPSNPYTGKLAIPPLPRAKYGSAKHRLAFRLSEADMHAFVALEEAAQEFAGVNATSIFKRAIRFYNAHLQSIKHDASKQAHEALELRRGTYAA
jgi:hypothetical protein